MANYSLIDLHNHTAHSRESGCNNSISDVFRDAQTIAERSGKDALVAITDHNTVVGINEARQILSAGKFDKVKLISGAEFTVDMSEINGVFGGNRVFGNMHILAYGFDENNEALIKFSKDFHSGRRGNIKYSELVNLMKNAGGKLVIAHPGIIKVYPKNTMNYSGSNYQDELTDIRNNARRSKTILRHVPNGKVLLRILVERLTKLGGGTLVGMERFHPDNYYRNFDKEIEKICNEYGFVQTAGSDFHGYNLHTDFSVGNPFTVNFQEFYKHTLQDSMNYRNGLHVSHLPNIELLTGEGQPSNEIKMITANGEEVTYEQYNSVRHAHHEREKELYTSEKNGEYNRGGSNQKSNSGNGGSNNHKKKGKKGKKKHKNRSNNRSNYQSQNEPKQFGEE